MTNDHHQESQIMPGYWGWPFVLLSVFSVMAATAGAEDPDPRISQIREAWQKRQEAFPHVTVIATLESEKRHIADEEGSQIPRVTSEYDKISTTYEWRLSDDMTDIRMRLNRSTDPRTPPYTRGTSTSLGSQSYWKQTKTDQKGVVGNGNTSGTPHAGESTIKARGPVVWFFRPLSEPLSQIDLEQCQIAEETGEIEGVTCWLLRERRTDAGQEQELWLDPLQDYCVRRRISSLNSVLQSRYDVEYRASDEHGTVPVSWRSTHLDSHGRLQLSLNVKIVSIQTNEPIPADTFKWAFEPGTLVTNDDTQEEYFIKADGSHGPSPYVRPRRTTAAKSAAVIPLKSPGPSWPWLKILLGLFGLVAVSGFLVQRRVRARR